MKKYLIGIFTLFHVLTMAQGHKGSVDNCAPMKNGKVCYTDEVEMPGMSRKDLFNAIHAWAKKNYAKDVFLSNVAVNKAESSILVSSKIELLLTDSIKTRLSYKMTITCNDGYYLCELKDIRYQYDADNNKRYKTYAAEEVIADNGLSNTAETVKDPVLFCNATFFFVESLFADVHTAASGNKDNTEKKVNEKKGEDSKGGTKKQKMESV